MPILQRHTGAAARTPRIKRYVGQLLVWPRARGKEEIHVTTPPQTASTPIRELSNGRHIPLLGLGVWQVPNGPKTVNAVRWALELGYRHIDTAQLYGNEESVGRALEESGLARAEVFITTKFLPSREDPVAELQHSLRRLGLDYVDLYLVHWPQGSATRAWPHMERAHALGYAASIGVSNFSLHDLDAVIAIASTPPVVNQVPFSPFDYAPTMLEGAARRGVVIEAYSPLGTGRYLSSNTVRRIAAKIGRTPAQVLLRWGLQHDLVVLPKSTHRERIEENAHIFDFALDEQDMAILDNLTATAS
jgi:diketogulonate reductase-like aldo/keto reductase